MQMLAVVTPIPSEATLLAVTGLPRGAFILFPCPPLKATAPKDPSCNARTGGMIFWYVVTGDGILIPASHSCGIGRCLQSVMLSCPSCPLVLH